MPAYYPPGVNLDIDFTTSTLGGMTFARASTATDSIYTDAAGSSYNTFPNDTPRFSATWGLLSETQTRTNYLLNSTAPATQTTSSLAVANHALWVIGTGSATVTAGTGVATGLGTATPGTPLIFAVTTAGTFTVTVTGSLNRFQLERGGSPTSFIVTAGAIATRAVETCTLATGAWFNATAGTLLVDCSLPIININTNNTGFVALDDGTTNNRITLSQNPNAQSLMTAAAVSQVNAAVPQAPFTSGATVRLSQRYSATLNTQRMAANAVLAAIEQTGKTIPSVTQLSIVLGATAGLGTTIFIRRIQYWNSALSDFDQQVATSLQPIWGVASMGAMTSAGTLIQETPMTGTGVMPAMRATGNLYQQDIVTGVALNLDFMTPGLLDPRLTFARSSVATYYGVNGLLQTAYNYLRNNTMVGAVAGTPGTLPTNWIVPGPLNGLAYQVVATGTTSGMPYIDVRFSGTTTGAGTFTNFSFEATNNIPATNGQTWTTSLYVALVAGSMTNVGALSLGAGIYNSTPTYLNELGSGRGQLLPGLTGTLARQSFAGAVNQATAAWMQPYLQFTYTAGGGLAIDFTLRLAAIQAEIAATATSVIYTSGTGNGGPRWDYDPVTHVLKGLLIEDQRTNQMLASADFSGWSPTPVGCVTIANNATTSPDGTNNAASVVTGDVLNNSHGFFKAFTGGAINTPYAASIFAKANAYSRFTLFFGNTAFASGVIGALFDLANGTIVATAGGSTATITSVGNGWYRVSVTATSDPDGGNYILQAAFAPASTSGVNGVYTPASVGLGGFIYGVQVEVSTFATSLIPTTTVAVTRPIDQLTMPAAALFNTQEGSVVTSTTFRDWAAGGAGHNGDTFTFDDGAGNRANAITLIGYTNGNTFMQANFGLRVAATDTGNVLGYANQNITGTLFSNIACNWNATTVAMSSNGAATATAAVTALPPGINRLVVGNGFAGVSALGGWHRSIRYWPWALSNTDLQAITQLYPMAGTATMVMQALGRAHQEGLSNFSLNFDFMTPGVLDPRLTNLRNAPATYFDVTGVMQIASTNLTIFSGDLSQLTPNSSILVANAAIAPDGTTTATRITETAANAIHYASRSVGVTGSQPYTFSVYAKAAELRYLQVFYDDTGTGVHATFDLVAGVVSQAAALHGAGGTAISAAITPAANGFYRCSVSGNGTGSGGRPGVITSQTAAPGWAPNYVGNPLQGLLIWGSQLEPGLVVSAYIPTTTVQVGASRWDYDPITHVLKGLLIEDQRLNTFTNSASAQSWGQNAVATTANAAVAPDGTMTAGYVVPNTSLAQHAVNPTGPRTLTAGAAATTSMYVKPGGSYNRIWIVFNNAAFNSGMSQTYNLTGSGSLAGGVNYIGTGSGGAASITLISNGWYRVALTGIVDATSTSANIFFYVDNGSTNSFAGDGTTGIYMWGAQLEVGAFVTSLIPTGTASTWRWTDALIMPIPAASWFNPNEGSLLSSVTYRDIPSTGGHNSGLYSLDDGVSNRANSIDSFGPTSAPNLASTIHSVRAAAAQNVYNTYPAQSLIAPYTNVASSWNATTSGISMNGISTVSLAITGPIPSGINRLTIGSGYAGVLAVGGWYRSARYWPWALPANDLQTVAAFNPTTGAATIGPMQAAGTGQGQQFYTLSGTLTMGAMQARGIGQGQQFYTLTTVGGGGFRIVLSATGSMLQAYGLTGTGLMGPMRGGSALVYQGMIGRLLMVMQARGQGAQEEQGYGTGFMGPMRANGTGAINYGFAVKMLLGALRANVQMRRGYDLTVTMRLPAIRAIGQFGQRINLSGKMFIGPMDVRGGLLLDTPRLILPPLLSMGQTGGALLALPGTGSSGSQLVAPWFPSTMSKGQTNQSRILQQHYRGDATEELPDGINTMLMTYTVTWDATFGQGDYLINWLRTYVGNDVRWIVPGEATARYWRIKEWKRSTPAPDHDVVEATLEERPLP